MRFPRNPVWPARRRQQNRVLTPIPLVHRGWSHLEEQAVCIWQLRVAALLRKSGPGSDPRTYRCRYCSSAGGGNTQRSLLQQYFGALRGDPVRRQDNRYRSPSGCPAASLSPTGTCLVQTGLTIRPAPAQLNPNLQWTTKIDFTPRPADSISGRYIETPVI